MSNKKNSLIYQTICGLVATSMLGGCTLNSKTPLLSTSTPYTTITYTGNDSADSQRKRVCVEKYLVSKNITDYRLNSDLNEIQFPTNSLEETIRKSTLNELNKTCDITKNGSINVPTIVLTVGGAAGLIKAASSMGGGGGGGSSSGGGGTTPPVAPPGGSSPTPPGGI